VLSALVRRLRSERGVSLPEVLIVMVLLGVVSTVVLSGSVAAMRASTTTERRTTSLTESQRALERVTRQIRASDAREHTIPRAALLRAGPSRLSVDVDDVSQRSRITYFLETVGGTTRLCQHRQTYPNGSTPPALLTSPPCQAELVRGLVGLETQPVFGLYSGTASGTCVAGCPGSSGVPSTPVVTSAQVATINRVVLTIQRGVPGSAPMRFTTSISLRNS
jgi:prepilin-type N-terminal cleavage/methylation domain-containing protein